MFAHEPLYTHWLLGSVVAQDTITYVPVSVRVIHRFFPGVTATGVASVTSWKPPTGVTVSV